MKEPQSASPLIPRKSPLSRYLFGFLAIIVFFLVLYSQNFSPTNFSDYYFISVISPSTISGDRISTPAVESAVSRAGESSNHVAGDDRRSPPVASVFSPAEKKSRKKKEKKKLLPFTVKKAPKKCDIFSGKWVKDESTRPLYKESECPYIHPQLTCQEHGRHDRGYQQWRWQPHECSLPAFNATMMLEALRGKRMLFVGDSLNRGQYASMVCLLQSLIPKEAKSMKSSYDSLTVFTAKDYNATIEFYWAPFLLESNSDNAIKHKIKEKLVRKSLNKHGKFWKGADVVVFNTYLWWMTTLNMNIVKGSLNDKDQERMEMKSEDAYRIAMKTMLSWVQKNMDLNKSRVFFTSMSPTHTRSSDWGGKEGNCYNETTMIKDPTYWSSSASKAIMQVIREEFSKSKVPISFINITQLSNYRKDAHTSIYKKQWAPLMPEQLANPISYADCIHWCLPGLQDTWNELLFAKLFYP
ncbi:hypothetical protein V2J09_012071 [Rumex salicifolius]